MNAPPEQMRLWENNKREAFALLTEAINGLRPPGAPAISGPPNDDSNIADAMDWVVDLWIASYYFRSDKCLLSWIDQRRDINFELHHDGTRWHATDDDDTLELTPGWNLTAG
jgi:hypothetical protein